MVSRVAVLVDVPDPGAPRAVAVGRRLDQRHRAENALLVHLARLLVALELSVLVTQLELHARLLHSLDHRQSFCLGAGHRLLAVDVLAGVGRVDRDLCVPVIRRGDHDGIDVRVLEHLGVALIARRAPPGRRATGTGVRLGRVDGPLGAVVEQVAHRGELEVEVTVGEVLLQPTVARVLTLRLAHVLDALRPRESGRVDEGLTLTTEADDADVDAIRRRPTREPVDDRRRVAADTEFIDDRLALGVGGTLLGPRRGAQRAEHGYGCQSLDEAAAVDGLVAAALGVEMFAAVLDRLVALVVSHCYLRA